MDFAHTKCLIKQEVEEMMGSLKRKLGADAAVEDTPPPTQKQQKDNGGDVGMKETVACVHEVCYLIGYVVPSNKTVDKQANAKEFPFTLDHFQTETIKCLDNGESFMVCFLNFTEMHLGLWVITYKVFIMLFNDVMCGWMNRFLPIRQLERQLLPYTLLLCHCGTSLDDSPSPLFC